MKIGKAQEWFSEWDSKLSGQTKVGGKHYQPLWDQAIRLKGAIEVPVLLDGATISIRSSSDPSAPTGPTRLLIADYGSGHIYGAILKYQPSLDFKENMAEINRNNFREKKFSGVILVERS